VVVADERGEVRVYRAERLCPGCLTLHRKDEVNHLAERRAKVLGGFAFDFAIDSAEPSHEKVLEVPAHAVGSQVAQIVHVHVPVHMRVPDFGRIDFVQPVAADDAGSQVHVKSLQRVAGVGVLVDTPVQLLKVLLDRFTRIQ
jgi:hypothetical protein